MVPMQVERTLKLPMNQVAAGVSAAWKVLEVNSAILGRRAIISAVQDARLYGRPEARRYGPHNSHCGLANTTDSST
jgi:hypothetical protein